MMMSIKRQYGFSITETMIAIGLGMAVTTTVMGVYLANQRSNQLQQGMGTVQSNIRFIQYVMNQELRRAGYRGCSNGNAPYNVVSGNQVSFTANDIIQGHDGSNNTWQPALPTSLNGKVKANTDVIAIKKAANVYRHLATAMLTNSDSLTLTQAIPNLVTDDIVFINDCDSTDLFKATVSNNGLTLAHTTPGNTSAQLSKSYQTDAKVMRYEHATYYIGNTGRNNNQGNPIYALFVMDASGTSTELVAGVEDLQLLYGVDKTADQSINQYIPANTVNSNQEWDKVLTIKSSMLLNSVDAVLEKPQGYSFMGTAVTPTDRLLRKSLQSVIRIRNQGL